MSAHTLGPSEYITRLLGLGPEVPEDVRLLVKAAPALLEALEGFLRLLPSKEGLGGHAPIVAFTTHAHKARAAIAQVRGERA